MRAWASSDWWPARAASLRAPAAARQALPHTLRTRQQYTHTSRHTHTPTPAHANTYIHTDTGNVKRSLTAIEAPSAGRLPSTPFAPNHTQLIQSFTQSSIYHSPFIIHLFHSLSSTISVSLTHRLIHSIVHSTLHFTRRHVYRISRSHFLLLLYSFTAHSLFICFQPTLNANLGLNNSYTCIIIYIQLQRLVSYLISNIKA